MSTFTVQVPPGAEPGSTMAVQSPSTGATMHVQVPAGAGVGSTFQVQDATIIGAPAQVVMVGGAGEDIFQGAKTLLAKQEFAAMEMCGCEAKNRYRISVPQGVDNRQEGATAWYVSEESDCLERVCCSVNRSLTLKLHHGASVQGPVIMSMHKPLSCQGSCCMRPRFTVYGRAQDVVGVIEDPWRCCWMDQQVFDNKERLLFTTQGSPCQCGMFCPFCDDVQFDVKKDDQTVADIKKLSLSCEEGCAKTNRFKIDFQDISDPVEKKMLFASAFLLDLEYFEQKKN